MQQRVFLGGGRLAGLLEVPANRDDGVIELRPHIAIPTDQAWFWTEKWQKGEREVDEDIAAGRVKRFDSVEELFEDLDAE